MKKRLQCNAFIVYNVSFTKFNRRVLDIFVFFACFPFFSRIFCSIVLNWIVFKNVHSIFFWYRQTIGNYSMGFNSHRPIQYLIGPEFIFIYLIEFLSFFFKGPISFDWGYTIASSIFAMAKLYVRRYLVVFVVYIF